MSMLMLSLKKKKKTSALLLKSKCFEYKVLNTKARSNSNEAPETIGDEKLCGMVLSRFKCFTILCLSDVT